MTAPSRGPATRRRAAWQSVDGIVLLDKPRGTSSTQALQRVRRLLHAAKAGHAGTLDPMATGMLPLCFGQATKACGRLLGSSKAYQARLRLGTATDTGDADGLSVREAAIPRLDRGSIERALVSLTGTTEQVPPMHSAIRHGGRRLYELARDGVQVERARRSITVHRIDLLDVSIPDIEFVVVCSKGTYIRVLGEDLAMRLGTVGHLVMLRRLWVEPFESASMVSVEEIERWAGLPAEARPAAPWLRPVEEAFVRLPRIELDDARAARLCQGQVVDAPPGTAIAPEVGAWDARGRFLGLVAVGPGLEVRVLRLFVPGFPACDRGHAAADKLE